MTPETQAPGGVAARPMGPVTAWLAADPERAEWVRRVVAKAPPMSAEDVLFAQRILFPPQPGTIPSTPTEEP
jgi:hypothetical protein